MAKSNPSNHYDLIVAGQDLSGLIAGALCARRGMRVLCLDEDNNQKETYTLGSTQLPYDLSNFALIGSPAYRKVVSELNFIQTLKRRTSDLSPAFQLVLPDGRISIGDDTDDLVSQINRELPGNQESVEEFAVYARKVSETIESLIDQDITLPPEGFFEKREVKSHESQIPPAPTLLQDSQSNTLLSKMLRLPAALSLPLMPQDQHPTAIARYFHLLRHSSARIEGGPSVLRQLLIEKLETHHSGEVRRARVAKIVTRFRKVQGVLIEGEQDVIGTKHLLGASPMDQMVGLWADRPPKRVVQINSAMSPAGHRYVLHCIVNIQGLPEGIGPLVFALFDANRPLNDDNAIAFHINESNEDGQAVVSMVANVAYTESDEPLRDQFLELRPKLLKRLKELMPFVDDHIIAVHSPHDGLKVEGAKWKHKKICVSPAPLWHSDQESTLGLSALPYDLGVKNMLHCGHQTLPGLGLEGEFAAGWFAAKLVTAAIPVKDLLKDQVIAGN